MSTFNAKDWAEEVAIFRAEIVGALVRSDLGWGELKPGLEALSKQRFRPPSSKTTRTYSVPTLQRWYYAYKNKGLEGLKPKRRKDAGHGRALNDTLKELLLDIRRDYRHAPATVIRDALIAQGLMDKTDASVATVQRLYREHDLARLRRGVTADGAGQRLRWQAAHPGVLWHGDVCHGPAITVGGVSKPLRIHALLDDASRYVVALEAHPTEVELDMLGMLADTLIREPAPEVLYLDNGATYRGNALKTACARLEVSLVHAKPYDPRSRGKIERFWRTLRERCLDHLDRCTSLHDVQVRLWAFLESYNARAHSSLMGKSPAEVWQNWWLNHPAETMREETLREAMTVRCQRQVQGDSTLSYDGNVWEIDQTFLSKKTLTVVHCLLDNPVVPWVEYEGRRFELHPVDPIKNGRRRRKPALKRPETNYMLDPAKAELDRILNPTHKENT